MATSPTGPALRTVKLNLWDTTSLIVGIIIGAGIFFTPARVFAGVNGPWQAVGLWVLGGLFSFLGALCFAELAATYPKSGGEYVYLTRAFGNWMGFLFAWVQLTVIRTAASTGILAHFFGVFATIFFGSFIGRISEADFPLFSCSFAVGAIVVLTGVNILGMLFGKLTQNLLTALKVLGISGLLVAGFAAALMPREQAPTVFFGMVSGVYQGNLEVLDDHQEVHWFQVSPRTKVFINGKEQAFDGNVNKLAEELKWQDVRILPGENPNEIQTIKAQTFPLWALMALGLIPILWTYSGWHEAAYVVAEVREKKRTIPLALMLGTGLVMLIYVAINVASLAALGFARAGESRAIAKDVLSVVFGENGGRLMALLVMLSCLGAVHGTIFTSSRIFAEMGKDHPLFSLMSRWSPTFGTPVYALIIQGLLSILMVIGVNILFPGEDPFDSLLECTAAVFWIFFFLTGMALFILRIKDPGRERTFRVPLFPVVPLIFCLGSAWMAYSSVAFVDLTKSLIGLGLLLLGIPLYFVSNRIKEFKNQLKKFENQTETHFTEFPSEP